MKIVPRGTKREMKLQSFDSQEPYLDFGNEEVVAQKQLNQGHNILNEDMLREKAKETESEDPVNTIEQTGIEQENIDSPDSSSFSSFLDSNKEGGEETLPDLTEYIFAKLESFGYPPRRLNEFEDEFVTEKLYPGGQREVTIIIPDRYYGSKQKLSSKDFDAIVQELQTKFGLSFLEGEKKNKKIEMKLSSMKPIDESEDENVPVDELDEIYTGNSIGPKRKPKKQKIASHKELIQESIYKLAKSLADMTEKK